MDIEIREESPSALHAYASVPIAFEVRERFEVIPSSTGGAPQLILEPVAAPYVKDYDAMPSEGPESWALRFDLSQWGILSAWQDENRVGGAVIAWRTPGVEMFEGRSDLAVLWDLRVASEARRSGVGTRLFQVVEKWSRERGARSLQVETQNVNVPACLFYGRQRCELRAANRFVYPQLPEEVQLLWHKSLG